MHFTVICTFLIGAATAFTDYATLHRHKQSAVWAYGNMSATASHKITAPSRREKRAAKPSCTPLLPSDSCPGNTKRAAAGAWKAYRAEVTVPDQEAFTHLIACRDELANLEGRTQLDCTFILANAAEQAVQQVEAFNRNNYDKRPGYGCHWPIENIGLNEMCIVVDPWFSYGMQ